MANAIQTNIPIERKPATHSPIDQLKKVISNLPSVDSGGFSLGEASCSAWGWVFLDLKENRGMDSFKL